MLFPPESIVRERVSFVSRFARFLLTGAPNITIPEKPA
jgi:hypothetical protein